eukprot:scaffold8047_cov417-Prasinococcus_capsulatus_cf.AAC.2
MRYTLGGPQAGPDQKGGGAHSAPAPKASGTCQGLGGSQDPYQAMSLSPEAPADAQSLQAEARCGSAARCSHERSAASVQASVKRTQARPQRPR